jgi:hypothetical protein
MQCSTSAGYRASANDCSICKLKPKCTTAIARKVSRDIDEDVREHVRALANTETFQLSCRERKKVEVRFAHMKRILKLDRLRLRGLSGARDEVLLTATAQNLRRLAKLICRGPPPTAECVPRRRRCSRRRPQQAASFNHSLPAAAAGKFCNTFVPKADALRPGLARQKGANLTSLKQRRKETSAIVHSSE